MALINCVDCGKPVSSSAPSCPSCGAPVALKAEAKASGAMLTTTQGTSKKLKLQGLLALMLVVIGVVVMVGGKDSPEGGATLAGVGAVSVGLIWLLINRIRKWWHHG